MINRLEQHICGDCGRGMSHTPQGWVCVVCEWRFDQSVRERVDRRRHALGLGVLLAGLGLFTCAAAGVLTEGFAGLFLLGSSAAGLGSLYWFSKARAI